jgi:choline dehydrogenase
LLELSGIGDAARLRSLGIKPRYDLPAVGEGLQDHYTMALQARLKPGTDSLNRLSVGLPLAGQILRYALTRQGLLSNSAGVVTGYMRSRPEVDIPDIQIMSSAATVDYAAMARTGKTVLDKEPGLTIGGCLVRPDSRGSIHVGSSDHLAPPIIVPNYLSARSDVIGTINMIRQIRRLFCQPSLAAIVEHELAPAAGISDADEQALEEVVRAAGFSAYHPVGTCRMGSDPQSVVDPALRVRGVEGLRIADASIIPRIVSGNTNAACIMIGEKLSDLVLSQVR